MELEFKPRQMVELLADDLMQNLRRSDRCMIHRREIGVNEVVHYVVYIEGDYYKLSPTLLQHARSHDA